MSNAPSLPRALALVLAAFPVMLALAAAGCRGGYRQSATAAGGVAEIVAPRPASLNPGGDVFDAWAQPFYPLVIGNTWLYSIHTRTQVRTPNGPQPFGETTSPWEARISGLQQVGSRTYFTQREFNPSITGAIPANQFLVRQDGAGLFELDLFVATAAQAAPAERALAQQLSGSIRTAITDPAARAPLERAAVELAARVEALRHAAGFGWGDGGPAAGEISSLRYPLRVGAGWTVRPDPLFVRTVTGLDRMATPAGRFSAWRLRVTSALFGPRDAAVMWFGHAGLVREKIHAEADATDDVGRFVGRLLIDTDQVLDRVELTPASGAPGSVSQATPER